MKTTLSRSNTILLRKPFTIIGVMLVLINTTQANTTFTYTSFNIPTTTNGVTDARGINNNGQVIGSYSYLGEHGFVYDLASNTYSTINPPLGLVNEYNGINDNGQVVGSYVYSGWHGFVDNLATSTHLILDYPNV